MFAYLIAEGYSHSKERRPTWGAFFSFPLSPNPSTFRLPLSRGPFQRLLHPCRGLYAIYAYEKKKSFVPVLLAGISLEFVKASYGCRGPS
jgi:hypothetical protein